MSFGSSGFGGFGSNQQSTFGGFGANNNNNSSGFGSNTNSGSIFGGQSGNTGSSMFGNTNTSSPFGGGGGFGSNTQTSFGSKPFGGGGNLFGGTSTSSASGFGGFGATSNNTSSGFGSGNTSGGLFGQNKTGFGSTGTTGGSMFGGGSNTTSAFGSTSGGFGTSSGFGATSNAPNNGTSSTPFQAFQEKEAGATNAQAQYQTITFQQPYQNYSLEELRAVDYNQGRRYGNQNGQAGAFGQSTGFGGFGAANTNNTSTGFGSNTNTGGGIFGNTGNTGSSFGGGTTSGFGSTNNNNTGGGLFGQNKPAGGLFGSTTTQNNTTGGGLFGGGSTTNTGSAFGSGGTGFGSSTGGGLFGQNNQTQNKPAFGGFGSTNTNNTSTPFGGSTTNTGGSLFGQQNQTTSTGFGTNTQTTSTGGGLFGNTGGAFGQNQQNQQQNQSSGGLFGGGGFGQNNQNNQQKPGGLFGSSTTNTTGGGLFGNNNQQQQQQPSGGLFGQTKPAGGLFGSTSTNQPAATGSLFGNANTNTGNTGGGLFGNLNTQNNQPSTGGGLFGSSNNQQKPGGLFGASTANTGGGLFGNLNQNNTNQANAGNSLFGSQNQQQQNQQPSGGSLFGASGASLLQTSMNTNPYGNDALFAGLTTPVQSPGPLATPLSSSQKNRKSSILPQHKLNPSQSNRLLTPQGKRNGGYGFTYSTYGTPTSSSSQSSPLSGSLFSPGSLSRSLGKSLSTSNLRNSFTPDTSILAPGAFATTGRSFGSGSLKKLTINRNINTRPSLFDEPPQKRVSFAGASSEDNMTNGSATNGASSSALVVRDESVGNSPTESSTTVNGESNSSGNRTDGRSETQQVNGNELTPVPENGALAPRSSASLNIQNGQIADHPGGDYYSSPSLDQLKRLSKPELKSVANFVVGREGIGKIEFNFGKPIDLSDTPLDKIFGDIVLLKARYATCYGEQCSVPKPALGHGLNYESKITLGNSWPRGTTRAGKKDTKHLDRLKRVHGTKFLEYRPESGEWVFSVPHFSTYGFDYDDDEEGSSALSPVPDTPAQTGADAQSSSYVSPSQSSPDAQSSPDDTFDFKKGFRPRASVPGQFGDDAAYEEDAEMEDTQDQSFLGERSVGSLEGQHEYADESGSESAEDQDMTGFVSEPIRTTGQAAVRESEPSKDSTRPKSILKTSHILRPSGTPLKGHYVFDDDWTNTLQRTISPKKQDRKALRETQGEVLQERDGNSVRFAQPFDHNTKTTMDRMDLMESLFGETDARKSALMKRSGHGMQYPYAKRPKTSRDLDQLSSFDQDFHNCNKPRFTEAGVLIHFGKRVEMPDHGVFAYHWDSIASAEKYIHFSKLPTFPDAAPSTIDLQKESSEVHATHAADDVPYVTLRVEPSQLDFHMLADVVALGTKANAHEQQVWKLLSLLFDDSTPRSNGEVDNRPKNQILKEQLSEFWKSLVYEDAQKHAQIAATPEEKAIAYLSCNSVADACNALLEGFDLRLATMVAQIGGDAATREDMTSQIDEWRRMDVLAEMDEPVRALYELIAGNCAQSEGKTGGGRENKASTFNIARQFNLDWRRSFGLRLWYGIMPEEPIEMAIAQYADALAYGKEDVKPVPWFVEHGEEMGWIDNEKDNREDLLWGVLKLYASAKMELPANIEDVLAPENVSGHPLNARLSFQLFHVFKSRQDDESEWEERKVGMPTDRGTDNQHRSSLLSAAGTDAGDDQAEDPLIELGDKLTITYAASLHTPEHWTTAIWVYMHLSSAPMRAHYIRALLNQYSHTYSISESDSTYMYLARKLMVPGTWMHAAAALQAKAHGDSLQQALHLIKADEPEEAHEVLCRRVGPESIITRDYDALRELMGGFIPTPTSSPVSEHGSRFNRKSTEPVQGWNQGGAIYFDYIELLDLTGQLSAYRVDEELNSRINQLLESLQRALEAASRDRWDSCGLEERVALSEISGVVAGLVAKNKPSDLAKVLKLPLTEDERLKHTCSLSTSYYRDLLAEKR